MKKLLILMLALLVMASPVSARSIEEVSLNGSIGNNNASFAIKYKGSDARVFYGNDGIFIMTETGTVHYETAFAILQMIAVKDFTNDSYDEFLAVVNAPNFADHVMVYDGANGKVISSLRPTYENYEQSMGFYDKSSYIQSLLDCGDGTALITYDYTVMRVNLKDASIIWSFSETDNIWKTLVVNDKVVYTCQNGNFGTLQLADGKTVNQFLLAKTYDVNSPYEDLTFKNCAVNLWDLKQVNNRLFVSSEDGNIYTIETDRLQEGLKKEDFTLIDLQFDTDEIMTRLQRCLGNSREGGWHYSPSGINSEIYFNVRFSDVNGKYLLADVRMGDLMAVNYADTFKSAIVLIDTEQQRVLKTIEPGETNMTCQNSCFGNYEGQTVIAFTSNATNGKIRMNIHDLDGNQLVQKTISLPSLNPEQKSLLAYDKEGYRLELLSGGCAIIKSDLSEAEYMYQSVSSELLKADDKTVYVLYRHNGSGQQIVSWDSNLTKENFIYELKASYRNMGLSSIRCDLDYNGDGTSDILAIVNEINNDDEPVSSHFMAIDGLNGNVLLDKVIQTGTQVVDKKKVPVYLISNHPFSLLSDRDKDGKPELVIGGTIYGSRRNGKLGYLYYSPDASGHQLTVGDVNGDGFDDILVVNKTETRLYTTRLISEYGILRLDYRKGSVYMKNNGDETIEYTCGLIGDVNNDGISDLAIPVKEGDHKVLKVIDSVTVQPLMTLAVEGLADEDYYRALDYDLDGDGLNEIFGLRFWRHGIFSSKTGKRILSVEYSHDEHELEYDDSIYVEKDPELMQKAGFHYLEEKANFVYTGGRLILACSVWDEELSNRIKMVIVYDENLRETDRFSFGSEGYWSGEINVQPIAGSDDLLAVIDGNNTTVIDLKTRSVAARYALTGQNYSLLNSDSLLLSGSNGLYRLDLRNSFEVTSPLPEITEEPVLNLKWKSLQPYSMMTIYDNNQKVYVGAGEETEIRLLEGAHLLTLEMDDGQGKACQKTYRVTVVNQKKNNLLPLAAMMIMLFMALYLGKLRKLRLARLYRKGVK